MGHRVVASVSIAAALLLSIAPSLAQSQLPRPGQLPPPGGAQQAQPQQRPQQQQPQQQAAAKPYKPVAIKPPEPMKDPSFEAFRKQLGAVAEKKDRRALAGLVAQNFFWFGEKGDKADKKKTGIENLAKAISLDAKDAAGWDTLIGYSVDATAAPLEERKGAVCAPAEPDFNSEELEALAKATGSQEGDWAYPFQAGVEVRAAAQPNAPVVEKLGMHFVRVMEDDGQANQDNPMLKVMAPSGKVGFIPADSVSPLGNDQLCYIKEGANWKIVGFIGGE